MIKRIIFISILLLLSIGFVVAFEVPSEFEPIEGFEYNSYTYTDNYGDDDSGRVIEVLFDDEYKEKYLNDYQNYSFTPNGDGTFDFSYFGENIHFGIGKSYGRLTVLFWNKDMSTDNLEDLIAECDKLNGE